MRIAIDACCWSNRRGFGRYTRELVTHMVREQPRHEYALLVDAITAAAGGFPEGARLEVVATREQPTRAASARGSRTPADLLRMSRAASRLASDVFFFPAVYSYFPLLRRIPTVVTFHDAIAETLPGRVFRGWRARMFWTLKSWLARRQAGRLLTVSENARARIAARFGYPADRIHVVPEAASDCFRPLEDPAAVRDVLERHALPVGTPLVLYVGGISPHKNLDGLLRAWAIVARAQRSHLVLVGDHETDSFHGCYPELVALRRRSGLEATSTFTGYVPNADLVALYNAATLLVLPSLDEGFGLPAIEAMACGLPVAASRRGSLPELVEPAGVLFDPLDHEEMAAVIVRLLEQPALRERLRAEGLREARRYSWSAAARDTVRLLEDVAR